jgi:hypothetical protein
LEGFGENRLTDPRLHSNLNPEKQVSLMSLRTHIFMVSLVLPVTAVAETPLPPVHDGAVITGPGEFRHDGELFIQGKVTLKQMKLALHGPIRVAAGATLELDDVNLAVSDPEGAPNGTSGLRCEGPAHVIVRHSTMAPAGSAHPMWGLRGDIEVDDFATSNSEFHLNEVQARLDRLKIFELEISHQSRVTAHGLDLVFLSTHSADDDRLRFENIPVERSFTQTLELGSGAHAELHDTRIQLFLLYLHGHADATLAHMDRVQLAIAPDCNGTLRLSKGRLGSATKPAVFPDAKNSNCPFHLSLNDVNVDTWDVYAAGHAKLTLEDSQIDELVANDHAEINVRNSNVYADWLAVAGEADVSVENSTVGALSLAAQRPDLATSQIRVSGRGRVAFTHVRFDCGIVALDDAAVSISRSVTPPKYLRHEGNSTIHTD